ncbi:MAG: cytochrome c1, partial [Gammaproteobacteria bacterium]
MKKFVAALFIAFPLLANAAGGGVHLDHAPIDLKDTESLKRGANSFVNYCLSCHSASYMRYNRIGRDLGMSDAEVQELISTRDAKGEQTKVGELMKVAMTTEYSKEAFGTKIPDLSVIARARGADWLYTYLRTFYLDDSRPTGMNNIAFA